jgi:uncharacterized damage-inducible protein DinB
MTEPIIDEQGRTEPPRSGGPVEVVMGFHRFLRETLWWKCAGLTKEQLRWSPVPSGTSLLGILKHSVDVERWWIAEVIGGLDVESDWTEEDKDAAWRPTLDDTLESVMAAYKAEAERSEQVLAGVQWNDAPKEAEAAASGITVGWVLTHMVEEVGRHCGHADLIRELIDGQTGE